MPQNSRHFSARKAPPSDSRRRLERTAIYRLAVLAIPESDPGGGVDTVADRPDGAVAKDGVEPAGVGAAELHMEICSRFGLGGGVALWPRLALGPSVARKKTAINRRTPYGNLFPLWAGRVRGVTAPVGFEVERSAEENGDKSPYSIWELVPALGWAGAWRYGPGWF